MVDRGDVGALLSRRPDLEEPLGEILAVNEVNDQWVFDDVDVETGHFGELVDRGIVEPDGDGYRLSNPEAVREAFEDRGGETADDRIDRPFKRPIESILTNVDWITISLLAGAILLVGIVRVHTIGEIYREGAVVLSGNDPYFYRYWIEQTLTTPGIPQEISNGEPLFVVTIAAGAGLLGGTSSVANHVLAWYPVVAGMVCAGFVYLLAVTVTDDRRIGVFAVFVFAVIPVSAVRTSIGFADHHALDYVFLSITALAVLKFVARDGDGSNKQWYTRWLIVGGLSIGAQILTWEAGVLFVLPVVLVVLVTASIDVHAGRSPLGTGIPLVTTLVIGAGVVIGAHLLVGFHATAIALSPVILAIGAGSSLALAEAWHRVGWRATRLSIAYVGLAVLGVVVLWAAETVVWELFVRRLGSLFQSGNIAETRSLIFLDPRAVVFHFGLALLLAVPVVVLGAIRSLRLHRWLPVSVYAWYFLFLTALQLRFGGALAVFAAVFAGVGLVRVAGRLTALPRQSESDGQRCRARLPDRGTVVKLSLLVLIVGGVGGYQSVEQTEGLPVSDRVYNVAVFISDYADERGQTYPENYVLSDWSDNRVYNYYVSGNGASYEYAEGNYIPFASGTDPDSWYPEFAGETAREDWYPGYDGRVGYIVLAVAAPNVNQWSTIRRLTRNLGSARGEVSGVGHYRVIYVPPERGRVVVAVVPGATLSGTGGPNTSVSVATDVDAEGVAFRYERRTTVDEHGEWSLRVAHPGEYRLQVGNESRDVSIPEDAVENGGTIQVGRIPAG